jgi:hypothetical protein
MPGHDTSPAPGKHFNFGELLLGIACGLSIVTAVVYCVQIPLNPIGTRDYVVYWATGKLLLHHLNPYDPTLIGTLEHSAGLLYPGSYFMRNPPWTLPLALLPGLGSPRAAAVPWSLALLAALFLSVRAVWPAFGAGSGRLSLLGYVFPPALLCVIAGQTSLFILLGMALFLRLYRSRPFWAGASLWFCTVKPHVLLPFALIWLVWVVLTRAWRMLAGAAAAMAASCLLTACIDPAAWSQYLQWSRISGIAGEKIPCLGVELRDLIHPASSWIAFIPALVGCVWALFWFARRRSRWDWIEHGKLLVHVSIFVAPYCWIWDQSVVIPALLYGACRTGSRTGLAILALAYIALDALELTGVNPRSNLYLWPSALWLGWYLLVRTRPSQPTQDPSAQSARVPALG